MFSNLRNSLEKVSSIIEQMNYRCKNTFPSQKKICSLIKRVKHTSFFKSSLFFLHFVCCSSSTKRETRQFFDLQDLHAISLVQYFNFSKMAVEMSIVLYLVSFSSKYTNKVFLQYQALGLNSCYITSSPPSKQTI